MPVWITVILTLIIIQRLAELWIARRNEKNMKNRGALEFGQKHHKWFIVTHIAFFVAIILEMKLPCHMATNINPFFMTLFLATQVLRIWCITSLGMYWNTKIIILPDRTLVKKGPYKYIAHPNYIIVGVELCVIPLLFGTFVTALIFPLIHILLLTVRIPIENKALKSLSSADIQR